ncbi:MULTISPECIES: SatD family protein [Bacillus]|uniref:SatD family protein n=1 Tax=Bacillus TaxID=1386 RepID=UPI000C76F39D|nr:MULTISPECIES: SatD family protein [Bacillus]PLR85686.1 hypothetical protein CVD23_08310 [Bacillus sp. V33-4]RSK52827.1 hypothetical protein EJA13_10155 [Bacillus canaveralius]
MEDKIIKKCVCISADVIDSRVKSKHKELVDIANELNLKYENEIITKFTVRAGDEIFGVVHDFDKGYRVFKDLFKLSKTHQVPLYVGVGFDDIFNQNLIDPNTVNGKAIWNSADAIKILKDSKKIAHLKTLDKNFLFLFLVGHKFNHYMAINYLLYFIIEKVIKRTEKQNKAIELIENNPDKNYKEIGLNLDYDINNAESNISKLLNRAEYNIVKEAEENLINLINILYENERNQ